MRNFLLFTLSLFLSLIVLAFAVYFYITYVKKPIKTEVYIPPNSSIKRIGEILENKNIIDTKEIFIIFSILKNKPLKAGYYEFNGNYSVKDIWEKLYKGKSKLVKITIIPGDDLFKIAEKLDKAGILKKEEFLEKAFDKNFLKKIGISVSSFEGFIYPDTYILPQKASSEYIFRFFFDFFKRQYKVQHITDDFYKKMIVASLLEKEASDFKEKRIIAGIIYKRLKINMPLQIDATVIYALKLQKRWNGKITKKDYKLKSKFNTYYIYGLPPTPISSFSKKSFKATINPIKTNYLYYFTKDNKKHIFSTNYREHLIKLNKKSRGKK